MSVGEVDEILYWRKLGITIPPSKPKSYIEYKGIEVEVPNETLESEEEYKKTALKIARIINAMQSETRFLFNDKRLPYHIEKIESQYGSIFARFYVQTDVETFEKLSKAVLFDGILATFDIHMKCYQTGMQVRNFEKRLLAVGILGEVEL